MVLAMATPRPVSEANPPGDATPGAIREFRCQRRGCGALLARVIGVTLVCLDGTRAGPVTPGMVLARDCPRCKKRTVVWL